MTAKEFSKEWLTRKHPIIYTLRSQTGMSLEEAEEMMEAYAKAELEEKDKRIKELEDAIEAVLKSEYESITLIKALGRCVD
jgi:hypothetical protein